MQIVTYRQHHVASAPPRPGVLCGTRVVDLAEGYSRLVGDGASPAWATQVQTAPAAVLDLLHLGEPGMAFARAVLDLGQQHIDLGIPVDDVRLCAPLPRPNSMRDFMLVEEHVRNSLGSVPLEWYELPIHWKGNCDTVIGPDDEVPWPVYTEKLDYELELGAIIGRAVSRVTPEEAAHAIAGYTIFNDWSARDIQFREMKVMLGPAFGKDFATSMGPCLTTADAIDIKTTRMTARVNGVTWSEGTLGSMRFSFPEVISLVSAEQPLLPGDVLGSGTIARGCGLEINRWIQPGDVVELQVEGIGVLRNRVGQKPSGENRAWWLSSVGNPA